MSDTSICLLVVDDSEATREGLAKIFSSRGFLVETASGGGEALEKARARNGEIHVALIDQRMGPPDGVQTMQELHRYYPWIETIILTGFRELEPGERALELGAFRYMSKPEEDPEELIFNVRMAARFGREKRVKQALAALHAANSRLGEARSALDLYRLLWQLACAHLPMVEGFIIGRWDPLNRIISFPFCHLDGSETSWQEQEYNSARCGITEYVIDTGESLLLTNGDREFREMKRLAPPRTGRYAESKMVVPMTWQSAPIGTVTVLSYRPDFQYTIDHLTILQAIANQATAMLQTVSQQTEATQLAHAIEHLIQQVALDQVARSIVEQAQALIEPDFTGLVLRDREGVFRRVEPVIPESYSGMFMNPRQDEGLTITVANSGAPMKICDTRSEPLVKPEVLNNGIGAMLVMPLKYAGQVLGVLYAHRMRPYEWSDHDVKLWSAFAALAAARLYTAQAQRKEAADAELLAQELGRLSGRMSFVECLQAVARSAKNLFGADACRIMEVDTGTQRVTDATVELVEEYKVVEPPREGGLTTQVIATKKPIFADEVSALHDPAERPELLSAGVRSHAVLPLLYQNRVIAVLHCLYIRAPHHFLPHVQNRMLAFANSAALALYRARDDSLRDRWEQLGQKLDAMTEPGAVMRRLAGEAQRLLNADDAVMLWNVRPASTEGAVLAFDWSYRCGATPWIESPDSAVMQTVLNAPDGLLIHNRLGGVWEDRPNAMVGLRTEVVLGAERQTALLILRYARPTELRPSDFGGLRQAALTATNVVQRLWLVEELKRAAEARGKQLSAVGQILQALRGGMGTEELLNRIVQVYVDILGCDVCTVLEFEPSSERLVARAARGVHHGEVAATAELGNYLRILMHKKGPLYVPDAASDPLFKDSGFVQRERIRTSVVYRLRVENTIFGLLFVNYRCIRAEDQIDIPTMRIWADLAASVISSSRLRERIQSQTILKWMSMLEESWKHSLIQKAAAIRNYAAVIGNRAEGARISAVKRLSITASLAEIDRLAEEIADAPVRVPQSWEVQSERIAIAPMLTETARNVRRAAELQLQQPVDLTLDLERLDSAEVVGYRRWLIYALEALLHNAQRRLPDNEQEQVCVALSGEVNGRYVVVRLRDNGPGISAKLQETLFKAPRPPGVTGSGMGIGAFLAGSILREHGGNIWIEETGPGGTTIAFRLPAAEVEQ